MCCHVEESNSLLPHLKSFALNFLTKIPQNGAIELGIDSLILLNKFRIHRNGNVYTKAKMTSLFFLLGVSYLWLEQHVFETIIKSKLLRKFELSFPFAWGRGRTCLSILAALPTKGAYNTLILSLAKGVRHPSNKSSILGVTLNWIWWWSSSFWTSEECRVLFFFFFFLNCYYS